MKKNETLPPYSAMTMRNEINNFMLKQGKVKGPVVGSVSTSMNGNIVLTTIPPYTAEVLKTHQPLWKDAIKTLPVHSCEIQQPWLKLVAYGVSTEVEKSFQAESETYNPIKIKGTARWLKRPIKQSGSMVFAVETQQEQQHCLNKGLLIAGRRVTVVKFRIHSQYS